MEDAVRQAQALSGAAGEDCGWEGDGGLESAAPWGLKVGRNI